MIEKTDKIFILIENVNACDLFSHYSIDKKGQKKKSWFSDGVV